MTNGSRRVASVFLLFGFAIAKANAQDPRIDTIALKSAPRDLAILAKTQDSLQVKYDSLLAAVASSKATVATTKQSIDAMLRAAENQQKTGSIRGPQALLQRLFPPGCRPPVKIRSAFPKYGRFRGATV